MQIENILANNSVSLTGEIISDFEFSHEVYGEGFYNFCLRVKRLSESEDVLPIVISERLMDSELFIKGAIVKLAGQIRSYNNNDAETKKNKLLLTVFTRDISLVEEKDAKVSNEIYLNGYVCKLPVYRTTPFGREIADLLLAVNRSYNKSDYIPCIAWGRNARFSGKINVGDNIKVWGRMQSRNYQKKHQTGDIEEKVAYEVSISKIEITNINEEQIVT